MFLRVFFELGLDRVETAAQLQIVLRLVVLRREGVAGTLDPVDEEPAGLGLGALAALAVAVGHGDKGIADLGDLDEHGDELLALLGVAAVLERVQVALGRAGARARAAAALLRWRRGVRVAEAGRGAEGDGLEAVGVIHGAPPVWRQGPRGRTARLRAIVSASA